MQKQCDSEDSNHNRPQVFRLKIGGKQSQGGKYLDCGGSGERHGII